MIVYMLGTHTLGKASRSRHPSAKSPNVIGDVVDPARVATWEGTYSQYDGYYVYREDSEWAS